MAAVQENVSQPASILHPDRHVQSEPTPERSHHGDVLLRACLPADLLAAADFSELSELATEYVSDELLKRHGDTVWRLRLGQRWVYLLVLLEFQSEDDRWMALRIHTYTGLLYQELVRNEAPEVAAGRLPPVLPIVLYNGPRLWLSTQEMGELIAPAGAWLARFQPSQRYYLLDLRRLVRDDLPRRNLLRAVAGLEQSQSLADLLRVWEALQPWLRDPRAAELQRAFVDWIRQMAERLAPAGMALPPVRTLEEVRMTLVERVAEWPKQWLREGREQGLAEGREQGREQGLDQQRALLCRQAAARFGADTAARLAAVLAPIADPERMGEIGDWLVRCDTAAEFLACLDPASPS